jgi:hypothetical protein
MGEPSVRILALEKVADSIPVGHPSKVV